MNQKGNVLAILLAIVAALALAVGAYFFGQNQTLREISQTPTGVSVTSPPVSQNEDRMMASPTATSSGVTVVYEAQGSFSESEKTEIQKKVINPFIDYYQTENTGQKLLTLTISKNTQSSKEIYPYQALGVFQGGGNQGFLIMKEGTGISWWTPECLNGCNLSVSYAAKYPEVASKVK